MNNPTEEFALNDCIQFINDLLLQFKKRPLSDVERSVIVGSWNDQSYQKIADDTQYEISYIRGDVGCNLWKNLSDSIGVRVTKKNFKTQLQIYVPPTDIPIELDKIRFRGTPIYIDRPPLESKYFQEIQEQGALLRIRAPQKMGKTLLLEKVIQKGIHQGFQAVTIDFRLIEKPILQDLKSFYQWVCVNVAEELELDAHLKQRWSDSRGLNSNFSRYFESYILPQLDVPLILGLDNVDILFDEKDVSTEFFKVLRWMHESSKRHGRAAAMWRQLRVVLVYSTQDYPKNDLNHSPFNNVGFSRELAQFGLAQTQTCAQSYALNVDSDAQDLESFHQLLAGHPYLIQEALAYMNEHKVNLSKFLDIAVTNKSPFRAYLSALLASLRRNKELSQAFKSVLLSNTPVPVHSPYDFQLESMGLIKLEVDGWQIANGLYSKFFTAHQDEL